MNGDPRPAPREPVLRMRGVEKSFATPRGPVRVLSNLDLDIAPGEFVAVTGPSGSGKSTFLNLASLLDHPTAGSVRFDGEEIGGLDEPALCELRKRKIGMVFQKFCLLPHRTARENVLFRFRYLDGDPADAARRTDEAIDLMGLAHVRDTPARLLSGGEMQRTAIARAVAHPPRLLVADEPTGNLDHAATDNVMDCFHRLNQAGMTILFVTHNLALLDHCNRRLVCRDGRLEGEAS